MENVNLHLILYSLAGYICNATTSEGGPNGPLSQLAFCEAPNEPLEITNSQPPVRTE